MRKIILIIVIVGILVAVAFLLGRGLGFGGGVGSGKGDGNTKMATSIDKSTDVENDTVIEEKEEIVTEEQNDNTADVYEGAVYKITVTENEYYFDNERINLDEFCARIKQTEGDAVVQIKDDNASLKAYNALTDRLKEDHFRYVEE